MYDVSLKESHFPAQGEPPEAITLGELLKRSAEHYADAPALIELTYAGEYGRKWS